MIKLRVNRIKNDEEFKKSLTTQYRMIYEIGVQTGLRISDILALTPSNFENCIMHTIEQKTGKEKIAEVSKEVADFVCNFPANERIFKMTRQAAWKVFKSHAKKLKIKRVGTHSMRKKYAYDLYQKEKKFSKVQKALNHDYLGTTLAYLIEED